MSWWNSVCKHNTFSPNNCFTDEDGDMVTFASTEELEIAIESKDTDLVKIYVHHGKYKYYFTFIKDTVRINNTFVTIQLKFLKDWENILIDNAFEF
jgi:hypothetical protein